MKPTIKGREKLLKHFKNVNEPWWKLYNASDMRTPIQVQLNKKTNSIVTSEGYLTDLLDSVDPSGTFVLETFGLQQADEGFKRPSTSMSFTLNEQYGASEPEEKVSGTKSVPGFTGQLGIREHVALINENAKLSAECETWKSKYNDILKKNIELENLVEELEDEIEELEEELEELEEGGEKKEGTERLIGAVTKVVEEHGGTLVEHFTGKKGKGGSQVHGMPDEEEEEYEEEHISGQENNSEESESNEEEGEDVAMNGITQLPEIPEIIEELKKHDAKLQRHLFKLLLIAQQKPNTFKILLGKIEDF